jgi:LmbE family N-acetylglucosaminyl deacetylase
VGGEAWAPDWICYYFINDQGPISFAIDVSDYYDVKLRALECYRSQFRPEAGDRWTRGSPRPRSRA